LSPGPLLHVPVLAHSCMAACPQGVFGLLLQDVPVSEALVSTAPSNSAWTVALSHSSVSPFLLRRHSGLL